MVNSCWMRIIELCWCYDVDSWETSTIQNQRLHSGTWFTLARQL